MRGNDWAVGHDQLSQKPEIFQRNWLPLLAIQALSAIHCAPSIELPNASQLPALTGSPLPTPPTLEDESGASSPPPALDSSWIAYVSQGTFGPYRAVNGSTAIALWATQQGPTAPQWVSKHLGKNTWDRSVRTDADATPLAQAPTSLQRVATTAHWDGYLTLAAEEGENGFGLSCLVLDRLGQLRSGPTALVNSPTEIPWLDAFSFPSSVVAVWATAKPQGATLFSASLDRTGSTAKPPTRLLDRAVAWQVQRWNDRLAVAAVRREDKESILTLTQFDEMGRRLSHTELTRSKGLRRHVDAAVVGGLLVVAWTQLRPGGQHTSVHLSTLDPTGKVLVKPKNVLAPMGDQNLVQLVPPASRRGDAYMVWDNPRQTATGQRRLQIARVDESGHLSANRGAIYASESAPHRLEFVAREDGLAALTVARACARTTASCTEPAETPTFVQFDRELRVIASEPVRLAAEQAATAAVAWDLRCETDSCTGLAALAAEPVSVHRVAMRAKSSHFRLAAETVRDSPLPVVTRVNRVARLQPLTEVVSANRKGGSLVATMTHFDPATPYRTQRKAAADGRKAPVRAILRLHRFNQAGEALGKPQVLSYRARSTAGMQLLPVDNRQTLVLWSALDNNQPEVFATLVDQKAQRVRQRMLTRAPGEVLALAGARLDAGYLVAWIDERDQSPQVHSAPLTASLGRKSKQLQLSSGEYPVSDISLIRGRKALWLAQLEGPPLGPQKLTLRELDKTTGKPVNKRRLVAESPGGGLAKPQLTGTLDAPTLIWLNTTTGDLLAWQISAISSPLDEVRTVYSWTEPVLGYRATCDGNGCKSIVLLGRGDVSRLVGLQWFDDQPTRRSNWTTIRHPPTLGHLGITAPGPSVYYSDHREDTGELLRMDVEWHASPPQ